MLKLIWVNYGRLDPLGKGYVGNRGGAAAIESMFGSDLEIFTEVENCWRREYCRGVDVMPGAVKDCQRSLRRKAKGQRQEIANSSRRQEVGRPARSTDVHNVHRNWAVDRPVDRNPMSAGTPALGFSGSTARSTGVALSAGTQLSGFLGRPEGRPEEEVGRPTGRPTVGSGLKTAVSGNRVFKP